MKPLSRGMKPEKLEEIGNQMERLLRGYSLTHEDAVILSRKFLRLMEQSIFPFPAKVDPELPAGTIEARLTRPARCRKLGAGARRL